MRTDATPATTATNFTTPRSGALLVVADGGRSNGIPISD
jgi:hypothetical protein